MIYATITQQGTKLILEKTNLVYRYSSNLEFKFIKDEKFKDYELRGYIQRDEKDYLLEIKEDDTFEVLPEFMDRNKFVRLSFALKNESKVIHLGVVKLYVNDAFGNETTVPPEKQELLVEVVQKEVEKNLEEPLKKVEKVEKNIEQFDSDYQEFNKKLESANKIYDDVVGLKKEIDEDKNDIDKKISSFNEKENQLNTAIDNFNDDFIKKKNQIENDEAEIDKKVSDFNQNVATSKKSIDDQTTSAVELINKTKEQSLNELSETKETIDNDISSKQKDIDGLVENSKKEINDLADNSLENIENKKKSSVEAIDTSKTNALNDISTASSTAVENVQKEKTNALSDVNQSKNKAIKEVEEAGEHYQEQIDSLQKESASQSATLENLEGKVELKLNSPYVNSQGATLIEDSDNGSIKNLIIEGNSYQEKTNGYNLFDYSRVKSTSISGVVITNNNDGSFIVDRTQITNSYSNGFAYNHEETLKLFKAGTLTLETETDTGLRVRFVVDSKTKFTLVDSGSATIAQEDLDNETSYINCSFNVDYIEQSTTKIKLTCKPMLYQQGDGAFEPYTGGKPSPSPEYPQEVESVDQLTLKMFGKNIFDFTNSDIYLNDVVSNNTRESVTKIASVKPLFKFTNLIPGEKYTIKYHTELKANLTSSQLLCSLSTNNESYPIGDFTHLVGKNTKVYDVSLEFTAPQETVYFIGSIQIETITKFELLRKKDNISNDYYRYREEIISHILTNPLRKLSDDVYDYIDFENRKIVRNVGVVKFDGSDDESYYTNKENYMTDLSTCILTEKIDNININRIIECDKLIAYDLSDSIWMYNIGVDVGISTVSTAWGFCIRLPHSLTDVTSNDSNNTVFSKFKKWLSENPITVYYQLATPTKESIPEELYDQLEKLKTYYPTTNIVFDDDNEINPTLKFDYKLSLDKWIEERNQKEIEYDKRVEDQEKYSAKFMENWLALQRTGKVYTVRFPKFEVSQSTLGEKLDANAGLVCEASTPYTAGRNDYDDIPIFRTFDVNAYVDEEGIIHITAFKGDDNFKDEGKVDVFVLTMSYYEKTWEDDEYWYYSITDLPKEGYTIARECINRDGSIRSYALYGKYVLGDIGGKPYSSKNLIPAYYPYVTISAYHLVDYCRKRGSYYSGGLISDYKYIWTRFLLKFANTNSQNVLCGVNNYSAQYQISVPEENVKRVILTNARASYFVEGSCISIGDWEGATSIDRSNKKCHSIARNVKILSIEKVDDANTALNLELDEPIATTETTYVTTMHYRSGYSDKILGRDGSLGKDPKSAKYPIVISGIELMVGGYEIPANTMMNILSSNGDREVYVTNDARKLSTNVSENMKNWKKSKFKIQVQKTNTWQYITKMGIDTELGCVLPISAGESGSGSATGFADAIYCDNASSGQREFLLLGNLWLGSLAGLSCLNAASGFSYTWWDFLARLSIGAVGGELT